MKKITRYFLKEDNSTTTDKSAKYPLTNEFGGLTYQLTEQRTVRTCDWGPYANKPKFAQTPLLHISEDEEESLFFKMADEASIAYRVTVDTQDFNSDTIVNFLETLEKKPVHFVGNTKVINKIKKFPGCIVYENTAEEGDAVGIFKELPMFSRDDCPMDSIYFAVDPKTTGILIQKPDDLKGMVVFYHDVISKIVLTGDLAKVQTKKSDIMESIIMVEDI